MAHILLLEDNHDMVLALSEVLTIYGHTVSIGHDGAAGVNALDSGDGLPDVILTDVTMPNMTGFEFLDYVKDHDYYAHIPVAIMSGRRTDEKQALDLGASAFILKPFKFEDLDGIIANLLA